MVKIWKIIRIIIRLCRIIKKNFIIKFCGRVMIFVNKIIVRGILMEFVMKLYIVKLNSK